MALNNSNEYTRFMVEGFSDLGAIIAPTAFQGSFFGVAETGAKTHFKTNSKTIEIDIQRNNGRRLAVMKHRGTGSSDDGRGKATTASRFSNVAFAWPLAESKGNINSVELLDRSFGENPFADREMKDRLTEKAMEIHHDHMTKHIHTIEYLARESALNGTHPAILGTSNSGYIYDFGRNSNNNFAAAAAWDIVGSDIYGDVDGACDLIQQNASIFGDYGMLTGTSAFAGLKLNTAIIADADNRRYGFVELTRDVPVPSAFARYVNNGFQPRGWLDTPKGRKIWIFTYDLTFTDDFTVIDTDTETPWMPVDKALVFSPKTRCDRYFGPMDRLPVTSDEAKWYMEQFGFSMERPPMPANVQNDSVIDPRMFYTWAYPGPDKKAVELVTQSSAILPTTRTDGFSLISGLTT